MVKWPFGPKNQLSSLQSTRPADDHRTGRRGICIKCGAVNTGSFVACRVCGFQPINDRDLALSLAVNEKNLAVKFNEVTQAIHLGAAPQLSDAEYNELVRHVRSSGVKRMMGLDDETQLARDALETALARSADHVCLIYRTACKTLGERTDIAGLNPLTMFWLIAIAAKRGLVARMTGAEDRKYVERAYSYRCATSLLRANVLHMADNAREHIADKSPEAFGELEDAVLPVFEMDHAECDEVLADLLFDKDVQARTAYSRNCPGFLAETMRSVMNEFLETNYCGRVTSSRV